MRVLLAENHVPLSETLRRALVKDGIAVDCAYEGITAERRALRGTNCYDIFIFDSSLPKKSSVKICKSIREKNISIPILIVSRRGRSEEIISILDNGADDYISQPFPIEEFQARYRALVRRSPQLYGTSVITHQGFAINFSARTFHFQKKEIEVTPKEFSILEYFMRHPNQVLKRQQIIDHVWDFAFDSFSNVLDVHIKNIRKKIKDVANKDLIETVHGIGYRL